jgi:hypothetical protein
VECRRQGLTDEFTQVQDFAAVRDIRDQDLDKGMLAVERGASLVFRAHDPLNRCKVQLAKRIVLIAEETLSSSTVLDRLGPDVHHLAAYERFDRFSSISGTELCKRHESPPLIGVHSRRDSSRHAAFAHHDEPAAPQWRIAPGILRRGGITTG